MVFIVLMSWKTSTSDGNTPPSRRLSVVHAGSSWLVYDVSALSSSIPADGRGQQQPGPSTEAQRLEALPRVLHGAHAGDSSTSGQIHMEAHLYRKNTLMTGMHVITTMSMQLVSRMLFAMLQNKSKVGIMWQPRLLRDHSDVQVGLNKGLEILSLEPAMAELELTPENLDVPVPAHLVHKAHRVRPAAATALPAHYRLLHGKAGDQRSCHCYCR